MEIGFRDGIATVRFDDGKANALDAGWFTRLDAALDEAEAAGARALVLAGRDGMFSAGLNLKILPGMSGPEFIAFFGQFSQLVLRLHGFAMPTVAALTGHAIAGGAILAYACDMRCMTAGPYRLQLNETAIGMPLPAWMLMVAQTVVPRHLEARALLHAEAFSAEAALAENLIDDIEVDAASTVARAERMAQDLAERLSPAAYAATKARLRGPAIRAALDGLAADLAMLR